MTVTRPGNIIRPHDCASYFTETAQCQFDHPEDNGRLIRSYYHNIVELVDKLSTNMHFQELCFSEEVVKDNFNTVDADYHIK